RHGPDGLTGCVEELEAHLHGRAAGLEALTCRGVAETREPVADRYRHRVAWGLPAPVADGEPEDIRPHSGTREGGVGGVGAGERHRGTGGLRPLESERAGLVVRIAAARAVEGYQGTNHDRLVGSSIGDGRGVRLLEGSERRERGDVAADDVPDRVK